MFARIQFVILLLSFTACQPDSPKTSAAQNSATSPSPPPPQLADSALAKKLVGTWESISLDVTMNTVGGQDTTAYISANQENWGEVMQMQNIRTVLAADGTYHAEYRNLEGVEYARPYGRWEVRGDSLIYLESDPPGRIAMRVEPLSTKLYRFTSLSDFDRDGRVDDAVVAISQKIAGGK